MIPSRQPLNGGDADHGLDGRHAPQNSEVKLRGRSVERQVDVPPQQNLHSLAEKTTACAHGS